MFSVLCRIVPTDSVPETDKFCLWGPNKINIRNKVITFLIKIMQTTLFLKTFFESSSRLYTTSYRRDPQTKFKLVRYLCGTEPEGTILHNTEINILTNFPLSSFFQILFSKFLGVVAFAPGVGQTIPTLLLPLKQP